MGDLSAWGAVTCGRGLALLMALLTTTAGCGDDSGIPDACVDCTWDAGPPPDGGPAGQATILRDTYGVPHIFAPGLREAMYAWGWADAEDTRDAMLVGLWSAMGTSSRRLGAACGQPCVDADAVAATFELPDAVAASYGTLSERTRMALEAYAAGADAWFREAGVDTLYDPATPVTAENVVAVMVASRIRHAISATQTNLRGGSNQFAVTGARTLAGLTLLSKDPHNTWTADERYVHLSFDDYDIVGNGAFANMGCGGSNFVSFGCTRSAPATVVSVRARIRTAGTDAGEAPCGAYTRLQYYDHAGGGFVDFDMRCIDIDTGDSGIDATTWIYVSRFGILTAVNDTDGDMVPDEAFLNHVFAATDVTIADYAIDRMLARSALDFMQLWAAPTPREDAQYRAFAAADGHVGIVLGAAVPALNPELDWSQPVSSDDPRIDSWTPNRDWSVMDGVLWHNIDGTGPELPNVLDPDGDFVQNCNGGPTYATEPTGQVGPVAPFLELRRDRATERGMRIRELVGDATDLDVAGVQAVATDLLVPVGRNLVLALRCGIDAEGVDPVATWGDGGTLIETLLSWEADGFRAEVDSTAMTVLYLLEVSGADVRYPDPGECLSRAQLDAFGAFMRDSIAPYMQSVYRGRSDPLSVPWGYVNYVTIGGEEIGLPGGGGRVASLFVSFFQVDADTGRAVPATHGGSRVPQVLAYGDGFETFVTVPHGQMSEARFPASPHIGQTIDDFVARRYRRVPIDRAEVEASLCPWGDDPGHEHPARTDLTL